MVTEYVMGLNKFLNEAVSPEETTFKSAQQKYQAASDKDKESYKQYTDGTITKDQYLAEFEKLLQIETEYRRAQVAYKLAAPRGNAQTDQQQNKPGTQSGSTPAAPGASSNLPG